MLGPRASGLDEVGATQRQARRGQGARDPGLAVRPVGHPHVVAVHEEAQRDERPVEAVLARHLLGEQHVDRDRGEVGGARHVVPEGPERAEQDACRTQGHVVAATVGAGARRLEEGRLPAVGSRQVEQPGDGEVGAGGVQGGDGPDRADQAGEVVVLRLVGDPADQGLGDLAAERGLRGSQVAGESDLREHVREPTDAGVHAVAVLIGLGLAGVLREPDAGPVASYLVERPRPRRLGELAVGLRSGHPTILARDRGHPERVSSARPSSVEPVETTDGMPPKVSPAR